MPRKGTDDLGLRIKFARLRKGLTQAELAQKLNVHPETLGKYERGTNRPDAETLRKLADILEVSTDFLVGRTNDPSPIPSSLDADVETYLEKIVKGEIPIHFDGVERITPEVLEDLRTILKAALTYIRAHKPKEEEKAVEEKEEAERPGKGG
ncbi:transcriptional regulator, XRE family [Ammonifex degensii KC4]|uniref:Transcriptional regulator, XRE family n=1 Tax=Ammonifex degensii (strain DSM 10501 / KC4) TaxID=429009 RepID=C9RC67_AMMDK|nr:transcriptional regulator, XRE family [Ammonifex degensii KC4]